jgi:hypothetical protein
MEKMTKDLLISCGILKPEIDALMAQGKLHADLVFLNKYLHMDCQKLHKVLKASLNRYQDRKPVVVYGDLCLGFNGEMQALMTDCNTVKVDGMNCIDCLLGGGGQLTKMDPDHSYFFLTPAFIEFSETLITGTREENRRRFSMLKGIIIVDSLDDMEDHQDRIDHFSDQSGLPVLDHKQVGLSRLEIVLKNALARNHQKR